NSPRVLPAPTARTHLRRTPGCRPAPETAEPRRIREGGGGVDLWTAAATPNPPVWYRAPPLLPISTDGSATYACALLSSDRRPRRLDPPRSPSRSRSLQPPDEPEDRSE